MLEDSVGTAFAIEPGDDFHLVANPDIHVDGDRATASSAWVFVTRDGDDQPAGRAARALHRRARAHARRLAVPAPRGVLRHPRGASRRQAVTSAASASRRGVEMSSSQGIGVMAGPDLPRTPTQLFIAGTWRDAADGATFDVDLADQRAAPRDRRRGRRGRHRRGRQGRTRAGRRRRVGAHDGRRSRPPAVPPGRR